MTIYTMNGCSSSARVSCPCDLYNTLYRKYPPSLNYDCTSKLLGINLRVKSERLGCFPAAPAVSPTLRNLNVYRQGIDSELLVYTSRMSSIPSGAK